VENRAFLSWWIGDDCVEVPARIKDIGMLGASMAAEGEPPAGQSLWIRLEGPSPTDWIEVTLAWTSETGQVGVLFPSTCPHDLYKSLVPGFQHSDWSAADRNGH